MINMLLPPNSKTRELRNDELAIVPYDSNVYFVIRLDQQNTKNSEEQKYKVGLWNKSSNAYGENSYNLSYYEARRRLAQLIS